MLRKSSKGRRLYGYCFLCELAGRTCTGVAYGRRNTREQENRTKRTRELKCHELKTLWDKEAVLEAIPRDLLQHLRARGRNKFLTSPLQKAALLGA